MKPDLRETLVSSGLAVDQMVTQVKYLLKTDAKRVGPKKKSRALQPKPRAGYDGDSRCSIRKIPNSEPAARTAGNPKVEVREDASS